MKSPVIESFLEVFLFLEAIIWLFTELLLLWELGNYELRKDTKFRFYEIKSNEILYWLHATQPQNSLKPSFHHSYKNFFLSWFVDQLNCKHQINSTRYKSHWKPKTIFLSLLVTNIIDICIVLFIEKILPIYLFLVLAIQNLLLISANPRETNQATT